MLLRGAGDTKHFPSWGSFIYPRNTNFVKLKVENADGQARGLLIGTQNKSERLQNKNGTFSTVVG